uniref:BTB domain-containing protein n=1 Tax=Meloidogyne hapla TaxID=6305 RepID=A0A1I8BM75_MELHA
MVAVIEQNSGPQYLYSNDGRIYGSSTRRCKQDCEEERRQSTWRNNEVFRLNVGGKSFCFRPDTVLDHREPNSLLARLVRLEHRQRLLLTDGFQSGEYYLERNARVAEHVLDYFLTGKLHKPPEICPQRFSEELLFWRLTRVELAPCCSVLTDTQQKLKRTLDTERQLDQVNCCRGLRKVIWHLLESPSSSLFSKLFTLLSVIFIVASVVGLVLGSMPEFQADSRFADSYHALLGARKGYSSNNNVNENITTTTVSTTVKLKKMKLPLAKENLNVNKSRSDHFMEKLKESPPQVFIYRPTDNPQRWLVVLENCCIAWFTMDFLLRLLVAPRRWLFLRQPLNLIDLFTVLPFYCELALSQMGVHNTEGLKDFAGAMLVMRVLRVLRMARVFKLARYSTGLQVFGATLRTSLRELCMLSMFLLCGTIFFSTLMYYAEKDEPGSDFKSIPAACWWCIITVTTVGYGDCQILSWVGKLIAGLSSVFGIIILAFPISMVVENFAVAQQKLKLENQLKEVQMSQVANDYLMRRYPSRRKACRDPLDGSLHRQHQQNNNQKIPSPPLTDLSSNILNAPYSALSENFVLATN